MWLGAWMSRADEPLGLTWVRKMKGLGVVFGTVSCEEDNWEPKIKKLEKSLNLWRSRSLSLLGKDLIINTLGLSKLVYLAKVLILPDWVLIRVNALIWRFIWGCKIETVSRNTCYLKILDGGINLINFKLKAQALCLAGMVSIINSPCDSSFFFCKYIAGRLISSLRHTWAHLRDNSSPSAALPSLFYRSCLDTLSAVGNCDPTAKVLYC